jgi:hypothetical protein
MRERLALAPKAIGGGLLLALFIGPCAWLGGTYSVAHAVLAATLAALVLGVLIATTEKRKKFEAKMSVVLLVVLGPIVGGIGAAFGLIFGPLGGIVVLAGVGVLLSALALAKGSSNRTKRKK